MTLDEFRQSLTATSECSFRTPSISGLARQDPERLLSGRQGVPQNVPCASSRYAPIRAFSLLRQSASVRAWLLGK
jgi:hypothetical protein